MRNFKQLMLFIMIGSLVTLSSCSKSDDGGDGGDEGSDGVDEGSDGGDDGGDDE